MRDRFLPNADTSDSDRHCPLRQCRQSRPAPPTLPKSSSLSLPCHPYRPPSRPIVKMAQRVTLRKRTPYNTKSNRRRIVKTPGGRLVYHHTKKLPTSPKCGDCHVALPGVKSLRPREYANVSKRLKTVQRAYGGSRCANCVRTRVIRAFLVEEAKIVKNVIKAQAAKAK
ncbi:60S ribosomal protein L34A [Thecaphora frezii]